MKKPKNVCSKRFVIGCIPSVIIIILVSVFLTFFSILLQTGTVENFSVLISNSGYILFLLNFLPIVFLMSIIFFLLGNCMAAVSLVSFLVIVLSVVNYYKIVFRHEPLMPWDFLLIAEFMGIAKSIDYVLLILAGIGIIAGIILLALLVLFIRTKKITLPVRIIAIVIIGTAAILCNFGLYRNEELNLGLYIKGNGYDDVDRVISHGFIYSFVYNLNMTRVTAPPSYNKEEIEELIADWPTETPDTKQMPHIIMVMGETFSDVFDSYFIDFENYLDPLKHLKMLQWESVSGHIVTPRIGGGTSDTEFDVLTGIATRHFLGAPYSYSLIRKPLSGLPSLFSSFGYTNIAIHPGQPWFYNRENVYEYLGFDQTYFIDNFDEIGSIKGMYISEEATISEILAKFKAHTATDNSPLFEFCVTIQNHGPFYVNYKAEKNFNTSVDLTEDEILSLSNYFEGLADADFQLNALVEYLRSFPEPAVLVYYGDHIPGFSDDIYDKLIDKYFTDLHTATRLNQTPFLIWQNDAARELYAFDEEIIKKYDHSVISSNFLGVAVLDLLGYVKSDPYFDFVNSHVLPNYPVIFDVWYFKSDGEPKSERWYPSEDLNIMRSWEYYKLFVE